MLDSALIPAAIPGSKSLCIFLHGLGDSMNGFTWLPDALAFPWMNYLLVNAPDPYYGGFSWYDFAGDMHPGVRRSCGLLTELLDQTRSRGFPTEETFLGGFSQGCLMTIEMGCRYPHLFAGLIGISGYVAHPEVLLTELSPVAKQQRFLVTHGTTDPIVPFRATQQQIALLQQGGLNIQWQEFHKAHTIQGEAELAVIRTFMKASESLSGK